MIVRIDVKQVDIVQYYDIPKSVVNSIVRCGRVEKENETRGRNKKLSLRDTRSSLKVSNKLRFKLVRNITSKYNQFAPTPMSISTVR